MKALKNEGSAKGVVVIMPRKIQSHHMILFIPKESGNIAKSLKRKRRWSSQSNSSSRFDYARGRYYHPSYLLYSTRTILIVLQGWVLLSKGYLRLVFN